MTNNMLPQVGQTVRYLGGDYMGDKLLEVGRIYEITEKEFEFGMEISGFKTGNVDEDGDTIYFPISYGGMLFPDNSEHFELI